MSKRPLFQVLDKSNSAKITMNDNMSAAKLLSRDPAPPESWLIHKDDVAFAVLAYANKHGIPPTDVGYSVRYDATVE